MVWDRWCVTKVVCDKALVKDGVRQMLCVTKMCVCVKDGVKDGV